MASLSTAGSTNIGHMVLNVIQHGRLLSIAKLGELMPATKGGRGNINPHTDCAGFHRFQHLRYQPPTYTPPLYPFDTKAPKHHLRAAVEIGLILAMILQGTRVLQQMATTTLRLTRCCG